MIWGKGSHVYNSLTQDVDSLPLQLPSPMMTPRWLPLKDWHSSWVDTIFDEFYRAWRSPGWNPKLLRLSGNLFMFDICGHGKGKSRPTSYGLPVKGPQTTWGYTPFAVEIPHSIHVVEYEDHPFLRALPKNAPRVVSSLYKKEVRFCHLISSDALDYLRAVDLAESAWADFIRNSSRVRAQ